VSVVDGKLPVVIHHQISCLQFSNTSNIFRTLLRLDYLKLTQGSYRNLKKGALLINNAACTSLTRQETPEGIEMQFATNVLGYFRLIDEFTAILKASAPARIVNVASYWAGGLDLNDLEFTRRSYNNDQAYRQSKQAGRMLSAAFSEKLEPFHIAVNACHPGDVNSTLSNDLGFGGHETPDQGADTPVWLATHPIGQQKTGRYYEYRRESNCTFSRDMQAVNELYEISATYSIGQFRSQAG
jgi:NAD(P)-dependent dehydrogenase (short-subunit alcohol dehydrogenase family)